MGQAVQGRDDIGIMFPVTTAGLIMIAMFVSLYSDLMDTRREVAALEEKLERVTLALDAAEDKMIWYETMRHGVLRDLRTKDERIAGLCAELERARQ